MAVERHLFRRGGIHCGGGGGGGRKPPLVVREKSFQCCKHGPVIPFSAL